jgi:hypothetical protein
LTSYLYFNTQKWSTKGEIIMANQVQNQPSAAYWLSLIGGILAVLGAIAFLVWGGLAFAAYNSFADYYTGYYGDYYTGDVTGAFGLAWTFLIGIGIWMLICSILVIVFARKLKARPMEHSKWGILIIVFSIIGSWSILNFIGGILALVYKPIPGGAAPQQQAHPCPQCGTMVQPGVRFCPNCGRQQY